MLEKDTHFVEIFLLKMELSGGRVEKNSIPNVANMWQRGFVKNQITYLANLYLYILVIISYKFNRVASTENKH